MNTLTIIDIPVAIDLEHEQMTEIQGGMKKLPFQTNRVGPLRPMATPSMSTSTACSSIPSGMDSRTEGRPALPPRRARQVWARLRIEGRQGGVERPRRWVALGIGGIKRHARTFISKRTHTSRRALPRRRVAVCVFIDLPAARRKRPARRFMQDRIMSTLLRFGIMLVCLGLSATAHAQTYDDSTPQDPGIDCRAIVGNAEIDGTMQTIVGRACLQSDGTWHSCATTTTAACSSIPSRRIRIPIRGIGGRRSSLAWARALFSSTAFTTSIIFTTWITTTSARRGFMAAFTADAHGGMHGFNGMHGFGGGMHGFGGGMRRH